MTYLEKKISTETKVILHLSKYSRLREIYVVPPATTQQGIADSVRASRNYVSVVLDRLIDQGLVSVHTTRVVGSKRKKKAYFLTPSGESYANDLKTEFSNSIVRVLTDEGIVEVKYSDLKGIMRSVPDFVEVIRIIEDAGVLDNTKSSAVTPLPPGNEVSSPPIPALSGYVGTRKVCLLGDAGVGKTSLIQRYVYRVFDPKYTPTLGVNISSKILHLDISGKKVIVKLLIWDVMGNPQFKKICQAAIRGASGVLIICDLTRRDTLKNIDAWITLMLESGGDIPWILVINKSDLPGYAGSGMRDVSEEVSRYGVPYFFTSARTSDRVDEIFKTLAEQILLRENPVPGKPPAGEGTMIPVIDAIIDEYCSRHGGYEIAMNHVRIALDSAKIDLNNLTKDSIIRFINELVSGEKRDDAERERKALLTILEYGGVNS